MSTSTISTPKQKSCLYLASSLCDGLEDNDLKQVTTLLKNKEADPNVLMPLHGITPFHLLIGNDSEAFAEEVTKLFLRHGGNPNVKSNDGMSPVHVAAAWGRVKILELLLANGGDPLCLDDENCSPFHYAFQGEHYEAISVLSKYCIKSKDDENPKFKLELDKVLVNNGEVLAEYIVSDESFDDSQKLSSVSNSENLKINTSGYVPESGSTNTLSLNSDFITVRRKQRKRLAEEKTDYIYKSYKDNFNFERETAEEEKNLINEIISQLSSSIASDTDVNKTKFKNYESTNLNTCKTSSPKRKQITMTFNRPTKCNKYIKTPKDQAINKRYSTLQVIKQHTCLPNLNNNIIFASNHENSSTISDKKLISENSVESLKKSKNNTQTLSPENMSFVNKWLDETIISKSPNLIIDTHSRDKKKKLLKTPIFEKKRSPIHTKMCKIKSTSAKKVTCHTPVSQIPRPKKYFVTPCNLKTRDKKLKTPVKSTTTNKQKIDSSSKKVASEKSKNLTPLNCTYNQSESSTPSISTNTKQFHINNNKKSFKNIAINLNDCIYNKDEDDDKHFSTFGKEFIKIRPETELMSGVGVLHSEIASKSDLKPTLIENLAEEKFITKESYLDLNRLILDSFSQSEEKISKNCNLSTHFFDSLLCEIGSIASNMSTSFLSLSKNSSHSDQDNEIAVLNEKIEKSKSTNCNVLSYQNDSLSCEKLDSDTFISVNEEYKYEDPEEGIALLEKRLCVTPSCTGSEMNTTFYSCNSARSESLPKELYFLDSVALRERLKNLGENPGPVTKTTYHLYLKRLHRLESKSKTSTALSRNIIKSTSQEENLLNPSLLSIDWIKNIDDYKVLENKVFQDFATPSPSRKWREGKTKNSFNYLLLDPRITNDLPRKAKDLSLSEKWKQFLSAIFYIGKGKKSRPYAHLYDAFKVWVSQNQQNVNSQKIQRILDIWNEGKGVVVLHVFLNTIPVEAYTREAAMIEAIGIRKLGNCKHGDYYGVTSTWRSKEKFRLGRYLLFKAMQILLLEGERQIFPDNL